MLYADIIIDISHSRLDQTFQYKVPEELERVLEPGNVVEVPFGRGDHLKKGYVLQITEHPACPPEKLKRIGRIETDLVGAESKLTALALWIRDYYGSSTVQALRTVLPFREKAAPKKKKRIVRTIPKEQALEFLEVFRKKHQSARARLLEALIEQPELPMEIVTGSLRITQAVIRPLEEAGMITCETDQIYRTPAVLEELKAQGGGTDGALPDGSGVQLNEQQQHVVDVICGSWEHPDGWLIHGVTGSGKTAVYIELIAYALERGQQAILLIPEISLTYQNVLRFYRRFGERISILHSRLSQAERYDQFERARNGEIDVMIGPRSALFTPFPNLGMIIIDKEHEDSYRSETTPRYHARETARKRAQLEGAQLVLGSATPSMEAYYGAKNGWYHLLELPSRATGGALPQVTTVDLRQELKEGNRSILSRALYGKMRQRLEKKQQILLF